MQRYPVATFYGLLLVVSWPLQLLGGPVAAAAMAFVGPSACAFVVTFAVHGRNGVAELWGRGLRWRVPGRFYLVALVGVGACLLGVAYAVTAIFFPAGLAAPPTSVLVPLLVNFVAIFVLAGLGEEFGWRGFVLPRFQDRYGAVRASLLVGLLWFGWHIPLVVTGNDPWMPVLVAFLLGVLGDSFIYTWLFYRTGGSVLLVALMHAVGNTWGGHLYQATFAFEPLFFDVLRQGTYVALGIIVVALTGARLGRRDHGPRND